MKYSQVLDEDMEYLCFFLGGSHPCYPAHCQQVHGQGGEAFISIQISVHFFVNLNLTFLFLVWDKMLKILDW